MQTYETNVINSNAGKHTKLSPQYYPFSIRIFHWNNLSIIIRSRPFDYVALRAISNMILVQNTIRCGLLRRTSSVIYRMKNTTITRKLPIRVMGAVVDS